MAGEPGKTFFGLTPDRVLEAVEAGGLRSTGRCLPLRAFENRVYEVELAMMRDGGHLALYDNHDALRREISRHSKRDGEAYDRYPVHFRGAAVSTPRYRRQDLRVGQEVAAPCIIDEESCTTVVPDGWLVTSEPKGWLAIRRVG